MIAMLTALTCALSLTFIIPVPQTKGFVTLCEAGIYISALLFGPSAGAFVGGMSGGIIDFLSGYPEWAFFSIVIHGVQGWIVGRMKPSATSSRHCRQLDHDRRLRSSNSFTIRFRRWDRLDSK